MNGMDFQMMKRQVSELGVLTGIQIAVTMRAVIGEESRRILVCFLQIDARFRKSKVGYNFL